MFTAGPNAFLDTRGPLVGPDLSAQEGVLELIHSGVGKEQCGVSMGYNRTGVHDLVVPLLEECQVALAQFVGVHANVISTASE